MEKYYALLKNNRVENIIVVKEKNDELISNIIAEQNFEDFVWLDSNKPTMWATYDGKKFTPPTDDYLVQIGVKILEPTVNDESLING